MTFKEPKQVTTFLAKGPWSTIIWDFSYTLAKASSKALDPSNSIEDPLLHLMNYLKTISCPITLKNEPGSHNNDAYPPLITAWMEGSLTSQEIINICRKKTFPDKITKSITKNFFSPNFLVKQVYEINEEFISYIKNSKKNGIKHFILTNLDVATVNRLIEAYPHLFSLLDGIIVSAEIHQIKPNKKAYEYVLSKYSLDPKMCVFIDDEKTNCISAANLGIQTIHFDCK